MSHKRFNNEDCKWAKMRIEYIHVTFLIPAFYISKNSGTL